MAAVSRSLTDPAADFRIEVLTAPMQLTAIGPEWRSLFDRSLLENPFLSWEWVSTWWQELGCRDHELLLLVARAAVGNSLLGVLPLTICKRVTALRCLSFAATDRVLDHLDIVAPVEHRARLAVAFAERLLTERARFDLIDLDSMAVESALPDAIFAVFGRRPCSWLVQVQTAPLLPLPDTEQEFAQSLRKKLRSNLNRGAKRLEQKAGKPLRFCLVRSEAELADALPKLQGLHQARQRQKGNAGVFSQAASAAFQQHVAAAFLRAEWLRLHLLVAGEQVVAAMYCFRLGKRYSYYLGGYDPAWSDASPGAVLTAQAMREAISEGCREFDFLRGDEPYKALWTEQRIHDRRYLIGVNARGRICVCILLLRAWVSRMKREYGKRYQN